MSSAVAYLCRRMKGSIALVIIGVDPHKRTHTASVVETGTDKVLSDIENPLLVVPGFTVLLRQDRRRGLTPPLEFTAPHGALDGS